MKKKTGKKRGAISVVEKTKDIIECAIALGHFVSHYEEYEYINELEEAREYLRGLSTDKRFYSDAVELYEYFIACCYEKIEEVDTETSFHDFVKSLFSDWIYVRQISGCDTEETLDLLLKWEQDDGYGLCISAGEAAKAMDRAGRNCYKKYLLEEFEQSFAKESKKGIKEFSELPWSIRRITSDLKEVCCVTKDANVYIKLCEELYFSPSDCEKIANIFKEKHNYNAALEWVMKGLSQEKKRDWRNEGSYGLDNLRIELLGNIGNKKEAVELAWQKFKKYPCDTYYHELMKYVSQSQKPKWRKKAVETAYYSKLDNGTICLLFELKEFEKLSSLIIKSQGKTLEELFYYHAVKVAEKLERKYKVAAAKLYLSLTMNIVKAGRSKAYKYALRYCEKLKTLYEETGQKKKWRQFVQYIQQNHGRKYSFMDGFEKIVEGINDEDTALRKRVNQRIRKIRR